MEVRRLLPVLALLSGCTAAPPRPVEPEGVRAIPDSRDWKSREPVSPPHLPPLPEEIPHALMPPPPSERTVRPSAPARITIKEVVPDDWEGSGQIFLRIAEVSPTAYQLDLSGSLPDDAGDSILGPMLPWPTQRRPWATTVLDAQGIRSVVDRPPTAAGEALMTEATLAGRAGHAEDARQRLTELNDQDPHFGAGWLARADAEIRAGDLQAGRLALDQALAQGSLDPYAHTLSAEFALRSGDRREARRQLARALALYPGYPTALAMVELVTGSPPTWEPLRFRARVVPLEAGKVLVQADARRGGAWLTWALCQATTRFEVDRSLLPFDDAPDGVRLRRELACALALADAATSSVGTLGTETRGLPDPTVLRVGAIARAGFLGELTLYEIIAPRFPALLLHLSEEQRLRLQAYIDRWVLPRRPERWDN